MSPSFGCRRCSHSARASDSARTWLGPAAGSGGCLERHHDLPELRECLGPDLGHARLADIEHLGDLASVELLEIVPLQDRPLLVVELENRVAERRDLLFVL